MKKEMQSLENVKGFTTETEKELQEIMGGSVKLVELIKQPGMILCYGVFPINDKIKQILS
ncbi:hypothetical protein [Cellulosilyticum ruminicola]|uniref:hypothetical protein n=1 Tax=Cellulosilyticum ruminicola TaxID=425254 RepID=UPI0006D23B6A|nr:hypothetical protein [Cellulosilyticum ruminicola]